MPEDYGFPCEDPRCYLHIRPDIRESIDAWVASACPTGDFLVAVLSNNLSEAVGRADADNLRTLSAIVCYLYNRCPAPCWGSPERVKKWPALLEEMKEARERMKC